MLGVPKLGLWHTAYRPFLRTVARLVNRKASAVFQGLPDSARLSALISHRLLEDIVTLPRAGQRTAFHMPEQLAQRWGVSTGSPQAPMSSVSAR